ncbi:MAG: hypothetical protein KF862_21625 [Chitinophagaceae bacterium]|nr:hypothetical protein [Chitinophagaceae bacterium]
MNQKLPYEKLIAEKMQELPVPDVNASWQQMKRRLDEEMPFEGGSQKRPGGSWWWKGGLIVLVSAGIGALIFSYARGGAEENIVKVSSQEQTIIIAEQKETITPIDQNFTPSTNHKNNQPKTNIAGTDALSSNGLAGAPAASDPASISKKEPGKSNTGRFKKPERNAAETDEQPLSLFTGATPSNHIKKVPGNTSVAKEESNSINKNAGNNAASEISEEPFEQVVNTASPNNDPNSYTAPANSNATTQQPYNDPAPALTGTTANNESYVMASVPNENILYSSHLLSTVAGSLSVPAGVWQLPDVTAQKKAILREMRKQERKQERELAKSYRTSKSFWGEQPDRWFAAGVAPYQNFSIGSQQTYNYNSAGSKNIATDYIPAPYFQLHITNKVYVLSEFQFNAPQSTPSLLLSQKQLTVPMNTVGYTESTYLRKLYYFNMPLSFYYSPVKNFYVGSGMQFSSFNSGLAYTEQRSADNNLIRSENIKIKDDSLSSKITSSEWRYLFDANYYVNRFMFGFRYNQALNDFVRINNSLTPMQARNQSFQLYLRYNIIVSDKRK